MQRYMDSTIDTPAAVANTPKTTMRWQATTPGEELFLAIRDGVLPSLSAMVEPWNSLQGVLVGASGSHLFASYLHGALAVVAMRRLLRFWAEEAPNVAAPDQRIRIVSDFFANEVFAGVDTDVRARIARLVVQSHERSFRAVTPAIRKRLLKGATTATCYLCGAQLNAKTPDSKTPTFLTFEHLWPQSAGGDNIDDNLLPACIYCQEAKADALSWESIAVHDLILSPTPSIQA